MPNILDLTPKPISPETPAPAESVQEPFPQADGPSDDDAELVFAGAGPDELTWDAHASYDGAGHARRRALMWGLLGIGTLTAILQTSWSTALVVFTGVGAWALWNRFSEPSKVAIGRRGFTIDGHHIPHANLTSFDLHQLRDGSVHLSLKTDSRFAGHIHLPLGETDPATVHAVLSRYVPEEQHPVPFWESWFRKGTAKTT